jgi:DNA mismatch repair protein MutL
MNHIHILPSDLVNQIAAGEVIERPSSVVKELLENAIDAGAGVVSIEVNGSGCELIRVRDDGSGMAGHELDLAIQRHATSKISCPDDLFAIQTLGFRGEALPSILSVSRTVIATRQAGTEHGHCLAVEGSNVVNRSLKGMPPGTAIEVSDLFYNTPARRKFLKTPATEQRNVIEVVSRYSLAYPALRITLDIDGRTVLDLPPHLNLGDRAAAVLGTKFSGRMTPFRRELPGITIHGLAASPGESRQNRTGMYAFVNSRSVKDAMLGAAVIEGYSGMLMKGRYPVALLFVDIDPAEVDVNVHPSKAEVRFRNPGAVFGIVASAVRQALKPGSDPAAEALGADQPSGKTLPGFHFGAGAVDRPPGSLEAHEGMPVAYGPRATARMQEGMLFDDGLSPIGAGFSYAGLAVIGVLHATYILFQDDSSLYILDQHAAHERITFERLRRLHLSSTKAGQALLNPMILELNAREFSSFEEAADTIRQIGIECEPFGGTAIAVRSVPQPLADRDVREAVFGLIHAIMAGEVRGTKDDSGLVEEMLATVACHASVRAGKTLNMQEARHLLEELAEEGSPLTCPHGRPLFRRIAIQEIERWLGRRT